MCLTSIPIYQVVLSISCVFILIQTVPPAYLLFVFVVFLPPPLQRWKAHLFHVITIFLSKLVSLKLIWSCVISSRLYIVTNVIGVKHSIERKGRVKDLWIVAYFSISLHLFKFRFVSVFEFHPSLPIVQQMSPHLISGLALVKCSSAFLFTVAVVSFIMNRCSATFVNQLVELDKCQWSTTRSRQ